MTPSSLATSDDWPPWMRRPRATQYLEVVYGIELHPKTLANRNAAGLGPRPEYLGTVPYYRREVLDEFAQTAFSSESPVTTNRRARDRAKAG